MAHGIAAYTDKGDEIVYNYVPYHLFRVIKFTGGGVGKVSLPPLSAGRRYVAVKGLYGNGTIHQTVPMSSGSFHVIRGLSVSGNTVTINTVLVSGQVPQFPSKEVVVSVFVTE